MRDRIAAVIYGAASQWDAHPWDALAGHIQALYLGQADAVIAELDLEKRITSAVQGYAQSELVGIDYHDPMHHETAYGAMEKLNREAVGIARYAMKYRPDWKADDV